MALSKQPWLKYAPDLEIELLQCRDEGKDVSSLQERVKEILAMDPNDPAREAEAARFLDFTRGLPIREGYPYIEPCDIDGIRRERPKTPETPGVPQVDFTDDELFDRIYGAWLGRAAGCLLGKPVEGMRCAPLVEFNKTTGNYPITFYMSSAYPGELLARFAIDPRRPFINNVTHMPEDDDMNYTVMGLYIMEKYGVNFTSIDVGEAWLTALPILHTCTAERVAYKNLVNLVLPHAVLVSIGLLYGELDLERSIGIAVSGAFDTDCNGATVGSIVGMARGARALPQKWISPLNDLLESGVCGFALVKISDLARRSVAIARRVLQESARGE